MNKKINFRRIWRFKYRLYAFIIMLISVFVFYSDTANAPQIVTSGYKISTESFLASQIDYSFEDISEDKPEVEKVIIREKEGEENRLYLDEENRVVSDEEQIISYHTGFAFNPAVIDLSINPPKVDEEARLALNDLIPAPRNPGRNKNLLLYYGNDYSFRAPIIYSSLDDLYYRDDNGNIDFRAAKDTSAINSPVQVKLRDGVVHMANTPQPGELGNAYIIGHSSNYSSVKSSYNEIFKPLMKRSEAGERFVIYDQLGRELEFKVFEVVEIEYREAEKAYAMERFSDSRVVTLQASVLKWTSTGWQPTHRWLTRGKLILPWEKE